MSDEQTPPPDGHVKKGVFAGMRLAIANDLKNGIRKLMLSVVNDQMLHAEILAAGQFAFRGAFLKDLGPGFGNSRAQAGTMADDLFRFFEGYWAKKYRITPQFFLGKVEIVSPPTQKEIDEAWKVDIASSESAMAQMYEGSARTRTGPLETHGLKNKLKLVH